MSGVAAPDESIDPDEFRIAVPITRVDTGGVEAAFRQNQPQWDIMNPL